MGLLKKIFENKKTQHKNTELDQLKKREKTHHNKSQDKKYYFSEEAETTGKQIYKDKKEYVKNNPQEFEIVGAQIFQIVWDYVQELPPEEQKILKLTGEGKYYEDQEEYQKAITKYQKADDLTLKVCKKDIEEMIELSGPGDYLYCAKIRQRIRVCEKALLKEKTTKLEEEAKKLEKTNPSEAIKVYEELNRLKPGLKKYNKRIEICQKKLNK